ncbi:MAG: lysylphosphatidylglycerol synthase transmembrane domain-containing protein [Caldilineaceae bacterium]|jgi:uncharacterized membrane protein YbhN (UPF0104 family)
MSEAVSPEGCTEARRRAFQRWSVGLKNLVAWLIIAGFVWYLWDHRNDLTTALEASPLQIASIVALIFLGWLVAGAQTALIYRAVRLPVSLLEGVLLTAAGGFGNYLPMRAGALVRAHYLKEVHGLGYARFGGVTGVRALLTLIAAGGGGLIGLSAIWLRDHDGSSLVLVLLFLAMLGGPIALMLVPLPKWSWIPKRVRGIAQDFAGAYDELRRKPMVGFYIVLLFLAQYAVLGVRFLISGSAIGAHIDLIVVMMMAPLAALMQFASITPGGIGLREAVMGYIAMSLGHTFADGLYIGAIDRALLLLVTGIFGGMAFSLLWRAIGRRRRNSASCELSGVP